MRTLEIIEKELREAQEELKPIKEMKDKAQKKVDDLSSELEQFKMDNGLFRPMEDLKEYAGRNLERIDLVLKEDGKLEKHSMWNDEMMGIDDKGHLWYSSYMGGVMNYCEKEGKYIHSYYGHGTEYDFVGFLEMVLEEQEEY